MSCYWIRLGGVMPATEIAPHTSPAWETLADGGIGEVSFAFAMSPNVQHQLLATGTRVEVMLGAQPVATALMSDPDRTTWEIKAQGLSAAARRIAAVNALGVMTRDVGQVLLHTISNWWDVTNPRGVGGGLIVTGDDDSPQMVADLLDNLAAQEGKRWGVDGAARLFMRSDPTTHTCVIEPGAVAFGSTTEGQATQLVARYVATGGAFDTRYYPATVVGPVIHEIVDLTPRGELTTAEVDAILAAPFALGKAKTAWTNGVTLGREQITRNGEPVTLATLTAGSDMARATGLSSGGSPWQDFVIGKTRYAAGDDVIYIEPVNTAPRTFADVIAGA